MATQTSALDNLSYDEFRLLIYYRALARSDQDELLRAAGGKAVAKCLPERLLPEFMPDTGGIRIETNIDFKNFFGWRNTGTIAEVIRDGIEATGELSETLLGSDVYDPTEHAPRFAAAAEETATEQGIHFHFDRTFALKYIQEWRFLIAVACQYIVDGMARTVADAEAQRIPVPSSEDWIAYTLTLDGDRIAEELGWEKPGESDGDLIGSLEYYTVKPQFQVSRGEPAVSPILELRLALYYRLRFLQTSESLPPSEEQMREIEAVLDWLRVARRQN